MKHNPSRIACAILIVATLLWIFTYSFRKNDPEEIAKSEPNKDQTGHVLEASEKTVDQSVLNSDGEPMAVWDSKPYTPEQIAEIEAKIAKMFPPTPDIDVARITGFNSWAERYLAASPEERAKMEKEGLAMAAERRPEFLKMIQSDPQRALEMAVPRVIRQDLPESITKLLEQPVSAKGDLDVIWGKVAPGITPPDQPLVIRTFQVGDTFYKPYVYGQLSYLNSRKGIPLRGVALDGQLAVAENAVRRLENGERIPRGTRVEETCPVSGDTTEAVSEGEAVTEATPTVEIAERIITLCSSFHTQFLEENYRTYIQGAGSGGGGFFIDNYPGTASKAIGNLRCLYIRVTYPDQMQQPISEELAYSDMRDNARFYLENSYGKLTQTTSVTPTLVLPHSLRWYYDYHDQNGGGSSQTAFVQLHTDARAVAKAAGYDSANFDCILVRVNQGPQLEGISWGGGNTVWLTWNGMDVINHEVGHSLGRNHANYWNTTPPTGDGTPYGFGANAEYGNIFDNMGNGSGFAAHYNTVSKQALGWLPSNYAHTQVINGSYRLYAYDQSRLEEGKRYALNIPKDAGRTYNLEYHPAMGNHLTDAALLIYSGLGSNCGHLIDTTQGTLPGKSDAGIPVGRTYSDPEADIHITTLSVNDTVPASIDVMVNKGPFPGNVAPTATLAASATTITAGSSVTFTATASDTNGDTLAYFWEFDDGLTGTNTSSYTRTFATTGQYTAMLTVSDMKGGSVRRSTVINVGSHGRQTISGTVTAGGVGLQGVYISGGGKGCYTNADGTYSLSYQTGTPSLTATLAGYTFTNPLSAAAGSTTANWAATTGTLVTLTNVADTAEGGTNGTFRFTRTGSTASALDVFVNPPSGTATLTTDYSLSPSPATSGSYRTFTIPAGAAELDVTVTPANDTTAEGPETITMCIAGSGAAGSYYASGNNSVLMTIADNDTTLPQVSVTAPDRYAMEAPAGDNGTFRFSRTGATTSSLALTVAWSGTATNGSDYSTLSTTVTIPAGQSFVDVSLVPINDTVIEVPETAIVTISTNAAYLLDTGATSATVTTSDDDAPVVTVSALDPIATEGGADTGVFMLTRTGSTAAPLTVYYGLRGVAQHGTDYAWLTGEVNIPAGAASAPVVIHPFDDDMAEPTETMILAVTTFNNSYSIGTNYEATVQIVDNADTPLIDVRAGISGSNGVLYSNQAVGTSCTEGGTNPTFIIHSVGHGSGSVTVNYTVSGTATSGSDYTALSGTVSIPIEGVNDTTITVPIINDTIAEPTETLILTLTPSPNYRFYNDGSATVSIFDNENNDRVSVSQGLSTPTEAGTAGKFAFRRTKTVGALTVNYTLSGTATNGSDYSTLSGSVTIPDGSRVTEITVTPINDTAAEGTETVTVNVVSGAGYDVDIPGSATLEIVDNENPSTTVGFQSATFTTDELPGLLGQYRDLPVVLSAASANTITVNYYANGGNSLGDDVDWAFVDAADGNKIIPRGTLTFPPGVTSQNIRIKINNDGYAELNETAIIQLGGAYNAGLTATKDKQTITINDAAAPRFVRMLIPSSTRYEADGSEPMLQVILDRAAGASPITVNYAATGTATSGSDYTLTGTSLTFNTGELIKSIPLTLLNDAVNESAETIVISLSSPSGASLTGPASHAITLLDSSAPAVATQYVNAASTQATNTLITTATATLASGRSLSSWSILSGNTGNAFAINSTNGQITLAIPSSLPNPGGVQLIVRATDNTGATGTGAINIICNAVTANPVVEARWVGEEAYLYEDWSGIKSYTGNLATLTPGQNSGNDFSRRLTAYLKPTTTGNYTFYIAGDRDCRLYLSTDGYEARKVKIAEVVGGTGYQAWDTFLSQKSVSIPLVAGQVYWIEAQHFDNSGNDSVSVAWEGPGITRTAIPGSVLLPTAPGVSFVEPQGNGVVNTAPTISDITDRSTGINTSTGAIAFTIGDTETAAGSLLVSGSSSNLTLVPNSNIVFGGSGANRTVTITPASGQSGNTIITLNVTDGVATTSDTFLLAVGSSQIVAFKLASSSESESVTPANIQIEMLPANMSGSVSVDYAVGGGSATSGSDYTFSNGTLVFAPGETLKTLPITVVNDSIGENDETVLLVLGNAIGAIIGTNSTHTYTIVNDDGTPPPPPDPMGVALDTEGLTWITSGNLPWYPQSAITKDGVDAAQSGLIADNESSSMETTITGPGTLTFWWKVSSETSYDFLRFYLNGVEQTGSLAKISGTVDWVQKSVTIPTGSSVVKWSYTKDSSVSSGSDAAWVDQIVYTYNGDYTVTYDANGATSGTAPANQTKIRDVNLTLATNSGNLAKTGYVFSGWNTDPNGSATNYSEGATYTANANLNLFAKWTSTLNTAPTITNIADSSTNEDTATSAIAFTIGDAETAATSLTVSGTSSNQTLVPNSNIVFGGSGASRTVTVTPAANQIGTSTITVTVSDGVLTASDTFVLTVNAVNDAPTITNIADSSTNEDTASSAIAFTIGDAETAASSLTVSGTSSNQTLVPNANIVFGGSGANRTVTVTPAANQFGSSTITVTVSDSALTATDTFVLTINAVNDAPTITNITDRSTNEDTATSAIAFTIGDLETAATSLTVSGTSSNQTLVPNANIVFGGSGASRTVTVTPAANQTGTSTITVTVSDSALTATDTFVLTVNAVNDAPTITNIADGSTSESTATSAIAFTIGDLETAATSLTVSGTSSNQTLVPNANIVFGGSGASRTVTVTPAANQFGTSTITVTVSDGALTATDTFVLTVNAVSTVTFNANGGDAPSPSNKLVTYGSTYGTLASVTRSGYSLNGWFTAASGGTQVTSATTVTATDDHTLYAQWTQNFPEMDVTRGGTPKSSGSFDEVSGTTAGTGVPLTYVITNSGTGNLTIGSPVLSSQSNCSVVINTAPSTTIASPGNTNLALTVTPTAAGPWSFNISISSDDSNENPYLWMVHGVSQDTTTTPFTPSADTYINGASAGTNYGTATTFSIFNRSNGSNFRYGFMKFDLSSIPAGATITSATLDFVQSNATAGSVDIYEATGTWTETGATWTNSSTLVGTTTFGTAAAPAIANAAVPSISLNAAGIAKVQSWVTTPSGNNGFGIKTTSGGNGGNVDLHSREATTAGYKPKLTVTYTYTPSVSEMHVARAGSPVADAGTDTVSDILAGAGTQLTYTIANLGNANLTLTTPVSVSGATNCTVLVNTQPANTVTPSSSTNLVITVTPAAAGTWSANLSIANNDSNENPYNWTISGNAITHLAEWKQSNFGAEWNNAAVSGDSVDYDKDGTANLIEYALGTDPTSNNPSSQGAQSSTSGGKLNLTFNRVVANNDITIIIQASDNLTGAWTDIASSINGAVTTSLVPGVTVTETGTGSTRSVSVTDLYTTNDPAHPRRFMRIRVNP